MDGASSRSKKTALAFRVLDRDFFSDLFKILFESLVAAFIDDFLLDLTLSFFKRRMVCIDTLYDSHDKERIFRLNDLAQPLLRKREDCFVDLF